MNDNTYMRPRTLNDSVQATQDPPLALHRIRLGEEPHKLVDHEREVW